MEKNILTRRQVALLQSVGRSSLAKKFYLTGGTPLAAFYLQHRYSEGLDFFSEDEVDTVGVTVFLKQ